jgi:membrane protein DedA with SNARE-associated domain
MMDSAEVTAFLAANSDVAPFVASALAAAETTAFISIFIPSTLLLVGVGAAVSTGAVAFLPIWLGATLGAIAGSSFSFFLGRHFGDGLLEHPRLARFAAEIERARGLFARWGYLALFLGHFLGPLRPVVFLLAGASRMKVVPFLAVNAVAAASWAFAVPKSGEMGGDLLGWFWSFFGV